MRRIAGILLIGLMLTAAAYAAPLPVRDTITQTSTIDALLAGICDGHMTCADLLKHGDLGLGAFDRLDGEMVLVPNQNLFCAVSIQGGFPRRHTRSAPAQDKPYPPLAEVICHQPEFVMENVAGRIVGFRCPAYVKGINVPGYHLHFLSDDRTRGGHILEFEMAEGRGAIDVCHRFLLLLPEDDETFGAVDLTRDRAEELEAVEK